MKSFCVVVACLAMLCAAGSVELSWEEEVAAFGTKQLATQANLDKIRQVTRDRMIRKANLGMWTLNPDPKTKFGLFPPNKKDCEMCTLAFNVLIDVVMTPSLHKDLEWLVNVTCEKLVKKKEDQAVCEKVVDTVVHLLHEAERYGMNSGFNTSEVACSTILGFCTVPCCVTPNTPEQVHLTLMDGNSVVPADRTTSMRVSWVSANKYSAPPQVSYKALGAANDEAEAVSLGNSSTYTLTGWIGWLHTAVMVNLKPGTSYSYTVGPSAGSHTPKEFFTTSFKTFPSNLGQEERPLRVAAFADMGLGGTHAQTVSRLTKKVLAGEVDMIVHTGDISYADMDSFRWDEFMRQMGPAVSIVPYMTTPGNHEGLFNFTGYKMRFPHPETSFGGPSDAMYYTFSVGPIRFVMMDSETEWDTPRMDPVQVRWADTVMTEANSQGQFIMVGWHRPAYCSSPGHDCESNAAWIRSKIEPTLRRQNVGIVHTGHVHNYERSYPSFNGAPTTTSYVNTTDPVYFVNGVPGCEEGLQAFPENLHFKPYSAHHGDTTGFMIFTMSQHGGSKTHQYLVNMTLLSSLNGTSMDDTVLTKEATFTPGH